MPLGRPCPVSYPVSNVLGLGVVDYLRALRILMTKGLGLFNADADQIFCLLRMRTDSQNLRTDADSKISGSAHL